MSDWSAWIGREERRKDRVDAGLVTRWLATLDRDAPADGTVPQAFHWCLCVPDAPTSRLGMDGHPRRDDSPDGFLPPIALPRRMWASSAVEFHAPLRPDEKVDRVSRISSIKAKQGGSGSLVFVDIVHETHGASGLAISETQSIVYREPNPAGSPPPPPSGDSTFDPSAWPVHRAITPREPMLFRYSALTFNGHRIHYDLPYACDTEGYRGLVVHGPLTATLLLDLVARELGDNAVKHFAFRGISPAICGEGLHLAMKQGGEAIELGAFAPDGRTVMTATAMARN